MATSQLYENELATLRVENLSQKSLVEKLEADLAKACRPIAVVPALQADSTDLSTFEMLAESVREVGEADVASEQVKGRDADMSSYASIVAAQRDRLKQRVAILEQERGDEKRKTAILQDELERVKEDNGKLIGKIKFLQSYGSKKGDVAIQLDSEGKYAEQYERRIDPFRKFNQQESSRRMHEMRIHDRATYNIGRAIMTSGSARLTFFSYLLLLHLLVFLVLYRFAYTESCERDFETGCVERFRSHMLEHHPDGAHGHAD